MGVVAPGWLSTLSTAMAQENNGSAATDSRMHLHHKRPGQ